MTQINSSNSNSLPGIVNDQPEVFESEPALSDDTGFNDLDLINEPTDEAIALIEVPIKQAFSYFAERESEIAKFYVQRHGEYKIVGDAPDSETDIEKYHRLVSEVNQLLTKFQASHAQKSSKSLLSATGSLDSAALTNNLEIVSKQLKALEFAAEDGSLYPTQAEFNTIRSKLSRLEQKVSSDCKDERHEEPGGAQGELVNIMRMSALERRLNLLESLIGPNEEKAQSLFRITRCNSLAEATGTLGSWLSLFRQEGVQRVNKEVEYLVQKMEKIGEEAASTGDDKLDQRANAKLEQLCNLITTTDKYRALVPTIIHRLNAMEELQQKAAQVTVTMNHLEQVQSQIVDSLQSNRGELRSLNEMFAKNIELIKEFSKDIDARITAIRNRDP